MPPPHPATVVIIDPGRVGLAALNPAEQAQAARFHFERDARHWSACRRALRIILGEALSLDPAAIRFEFGAHGKPFLPAPHEHLHFNLSHCHDLALVALSGTGPVGIDLEPADRGGSLLGCEAAFCHPAELAVLPEDQGARAAALLDLWTTKEALLKALGTGMSLAPQSVSLAGRGDRSDHPRLRDFRVHRVDHPALARHVARVAGPAAMPLPRIVAFAG
jgi:4'-phosphopantetheinyl transferase